MNNERVATIAAQFGEAQLGEPPKALDAVDMVFAARTLPALATHAPRTEIAFVDLDAPGSRPLTQGVMDRLADSTVRQVAAY